MDWRGGFALLRAEVAWGGLVVGERGVLARDMLVFSLSLWRAFFVFVLLFGGWDQLIS